MRSIHTTFERIAIAAAGSALVVIGAPLGCRPKLAAPISSAHGGDAPPRRGGTLHLASFQDIRNLDPAGPVDGLALPADHLLFAGLVDYDEQARLVPDIADHWDVGDGGRTYRFVLRPGVTMHDGEELTADDVKRSAERALHPTTPNPIASYFANIIGYDAYAAASAEHLDGIVVEGRDVVVFHLKEPDATFLPVLAMPTLRPVCKTAGKRYVDTWFPCGAGPFKMTVGGWQRGTSLHLVRHDRYFRPEIAHLAAVEWTFNVTASAQRFRFEDGQLDILRDITQADQAHFASDPRWRPFGISEADRTAYGESMNTRMAPFDNVEIRRAVAAAIDREHYRALKPAYLTILHQLLPRAVPGYDPTVAGQRYDYPAALEHMRKAGYPYDPATGAGGWPKPIVYPVYDGGFPIYSAQVLQQDLAKIGLRIELKLVTWPALLAIQQKPGAAAISTGSWEFDYPDPSSFFDPLFTTASIGPEASNNYSFYSNPRFDDLVARARRETDAAHRRVLYREANELLCDEAPWAFAYSYHWYDVHQPYVRGFTPHPVWGLDVSRVWLDRVDAEFVRAVGGILR
jgi:ABC-type transport system substrate-binding protein